MRSNSKNLMLGKKGTLQKWRREFIDGMAKNIFACGKSTKLNNKSTKNINLGCLLILESKGRYYKGAIVNGRYWRTLWL